MFLCLVCLCILVLCNILSVEHLNPQQATAKSVLALLIACVLYFFNKLNILLCELDPNRTYYIICPTCCNHCIPCLMYLKMIYSFIWKCVVCSSYMLFYCTSSYQNFFKINSVLKAHLLCHCLRLLITSGLIWHNMDLI